MEWYEPSSLVYGFRTFLDLTQKELGVWLGVSPSLISHWELGDREVPKLIVLAFIILFVFRNNRKGGHIADAEDI
jgi:predicted transcriptional regulator